MPTAAGAAPRPPKPRAYVLGDSLLDEAKPYIDFSGIAGSVKGNIGRAPCDYLKSLSGGTMQRELKVTRVVVLETAGNSQTKCMLEPGSKNVHLAIGSPEWEAKYRADFDAIFDLSNANSVRMVVLDPPPMGPGAADTRNDLMNTVWPQLEADAAASYPLVSFASDPHDAVGGDTFVPTMPCLPDETLALGCLGDVIVVRAPDGLHFCPFGLGSQKQPCSLPYSPGARRYGDAIESLVRADL